MKINLFGGDGRGGPKSTGTQETGPKGVFLRQLGPVRQFEFQSDFYNTLCHEVLVAGKPIRYVASNTLARKRVTSLFSKEPTTIPWLETIRADEVLVDIGANVGMYAVYAGAFTGCRVFAFEPESLNYAELNKNIFVNGLHGRVSAFCMAMSDEEKVGYLNLGAFGIAYSHHDFEENTWTEDKRFGDKVTPKDARLQQGCMSISLDALVERGVIPQPNHIKIDVDGLEHRVVAGCSKTLESPNLRSVLIEIDHRIDKCNVIVDQMRERGWSYSIDQLRANRKVIFTPEMVERYRREKIGGFNYIFFRDPSYARLFEEFLRDYVPPMAPTA